MGDVRPTRSRITAIPAQLVHMIVTVKQLKGVSNLNEHYTIIVNIYVCYRKNIKGIYLPSRSPVGLHVE